MLGDMPRCPWATTESAIAYHDKEWGVPVHDDRMLFEFLTLEGAQAGLSWITILKKRKNYRKNRAQPTEDRGHNPKREDVSRGARRVRQLRRLSVELRRRQANPESLAEHGRGARAHSRIRRDEPRSGAARIQIRRLRDLLRVDASDGHGQRSLSHVSATRETRWRTAAQMTNAHR